MKYLLTLFISIFLLSSCTPARIVKDQHDTKKVETQKVYINRDDTIVAMFVPAIFGYDDQDKVSLAKGESTVISVPLGEHEFFVRSNQADRPNRIKVNVKKGCNLTFNTAPDSLFGLKSLIVVWYWMSSAFDLEYTQECDSV